MRSSAFSQVVASSVYPDAMQLLHSTIEHDSRGWFVQLGGWFAADSWLGYVRLFRWRRYTRKAVNP